jgi:predicted CXXCH cytochrome family protein
MKRAIVALAALLVLTVHAEEPHGPLYSTYCLTCHSVHSAAGASLTKTIANESLCGSCHNLAGSAARFPNESLQKADAASRLGSSHAWNVPSTNVATGAQPPLDAMMALRAADNIICSTCHNQHKTVPGGVADGLAGTQNQSSPVQIVGTGGTLTYTATATASTRGYLIDIIETAGAAGIARFRLSTDGGLSWFGWSGSAWVPYVNGNARLTTAGVPLNDGVNVTASFGGTFAIGDRIRFYVGYPFLRARVDSGDNLTGSKFCRDCHRDRAMDHNGVNQWDGTMRSHPVGIALNANGMGYDRATPLDAHGMAQGGAGDGNPTNDLVLAADQTIQCLTCHGVHHADGNSSTVDLP